MLKWQKLNITSRKKKRSKFNHNCTVFEQDLLINMDQPTV